MKKKILAAIISVVTIVACVVGFTGCASDKTFEKEGMQITLKSNFVEVEEQIGVQTVCYQSLNEICTVLKEEFSLFPDSAGVDTIEDYTKLVLQANYLSSTEVHTREGQDYLYFTYEKTEPESGYDFYYLATTHKGTDAYWLIQFACLVSNKDKFTEKFLGYADTVTFVADENN